jgi:hypothetical protein
MNQIMRLRRRATADHGIKDQNNGYGHEKAFVTLIEKYGTLHEAQLPAALVRRRLTGQGPAQALRREAAHARAAHAFRGLRSARSRRARRSSTKSCRTRSRSARSSTRSSRTTSGSS